MKRYPLITILSLVATLSWAAQPTPTILPAGSAPAPAAKTGPSPKIVCSRPNHDFKTVDEGPDIHHEFTIANKGKGVLTISSVTTSCGCTAAVLKKAGSKVKDEAATMPVDIPPGGKGTIKATYHTAGHVGHNTKIITVASNDPANPSFQLKLDMTVVREIDIQPERLYLYNVQHGQSQSATLKVLAKPGTKLKILSAQASGGVVTVTSIAPITDDAEKRQGATLLVELPKERPIGNFTDTILIQTSSKKKPQLEVPVTGEIIGKFQYNPRNINISVHQTSPLYVTFTAQDPKSFSIRKVESAKHLVRPSVKKASLGNGVDQWQVSISAPGSLPQGSDGKDQVIVQTSDPEQPQVSIDVTVTQ